MNPDISIIYVYFNTPDDLLNSINTLKSAVGDISYEVIVVDNASHKKIILPKNNKKIKVIREKINKGYGAGLNIGSSKAKGKYLVFSNPDILFLPHSIEKMVKELRRNSKIGLIGPQVLNSDNSIVKTYSGTPLLPTSLVAFSFVNKYFPKNKISEKYWLNKSDRNISKFIDTIGGACMVMPKRIFDEVKGFDERFFLFFEETDLCIRIKRLGYQILFKADAKIMHLGSRSMSNREFIQNNYEKSRLKFYIKYHGFLKGIGAELF